MTLNSRNLHICTFDSLPQASQVHWEVNAHEFTYLLISCSFFQRFHMAYRGVDTTKQQYTTQRGPLFGKTLQYSRESKQETIFK